MFYFLFHYQKCSVCTYFNFGILMWDIKILMWETLDANKKPFSWIFLICYIIDIYRKIVRLNKYTLEIHLKKLIYLF